MIDHERGLPAAFHCGVRMDVSVGYQDGDEHGVYYMCPICDYVQQDIVEPTIKFNVRK